MKTASMASTAFIAAMQYKPFVKIGQFRIHLRGLVVCIYNDFTLTFAVG